MGPRKYPLESLAEVRQRQVTAAAGELAAATRTREGAARAVDAAARRREQAARAVGAARQAELGALERGDLRAADLARADAWGVRVAREDQTLAAAVDHAREAHARARDAEGRARATVAERRAGARVVDEHHTRWQDGERQRAERAEEEAAAEAAGARGARSKA